MRFMIMHKSNAYWEAGGVPDADLIARVGAMIGELAEAGVFQSGEGLRPTSEGARLRFVRGERIVTPGPFEGDDELPAGFLLVRVASLDEAVRWATHYARVAGDVAIDVRPVTEGWDLGIEPKPEGLTTRRYMILPKADAASESGTPRSPEWSAQMRRLLDEMAREGVLLAAEGLAPSSKGKRIRLGEAPGASRAKPYVIDGPFTESKELIAGYVIVEVPSLDEAMRWADRYIEAVDCAEVDVRELSGLP